MNKSELVQAVSSSAGVAGRDAENVLTAFFETVQSEAKGGGKVSWPSFGSFSVSQRSARTGRNPRTGAPVKIAASKAIKFSASKALKDNLNGRGPKPAGKKAAAKKTGTAKKASTSRKSTAKKAAKR